MIQYRQFKALFSRRISTRKYFLLVSFLNHAAEQFKVTNAMYLDRFLYAKIDTLWYEWPRPVIYLLCSQY